MKRIYIALVLLVVIGSSCVGTLLLEKRQLNSMIEMTYTMEKDCREGRGEQAMKTALQLKEEFGKRTKTFALFLRHNELKAIEEIVLLLPLYLELDEQSHFLSDVLRCRLLLQKQWEMDEATLQNIF